MRQAIHQLLNDVGPGIMQATAYDTAWLARLVELDDPMGKNALEWLREHQLPDGTWGTLQPRYSHDRVICTLAAMPVLHKYGNIRDKIRLHRAQTGLELACGGLKLELDRETIGFEMLEPTLAKENEELGLVQPGFTGGTRHTMTLHSKKLKALISSGKIGRKVTMAFSAEMDGRDVALMLDANIQEPNGSVALSPSATAYFALRVKPGDEAALGYLRSLAVQNEGGVPDVSPFDVFERAWTLWNLVVAGPLDAETLALCQPHLDFLEAAWRKGAGIAFASCYPVPDSDVTSVVYDVLTRFGRPVDLAALISFEEDRYFRCYALEANPSISANIHVLSALRQAGLTPAEQLVRKVLKFLSDNKVMGLYWRDKWHASPYYPTGHAVIAAAGYQDDLVLSAVEWLIATQHPAGSWGYWGPTAEETAYSLQALLVWRHSGHDIPKDIIQRGLAWLHKHQDEIFIPMWVGKCLYNPYQVNRGAVLSALMLGEK